MPKGYAMYWLRKRILKYRWKRIHAAWKRGERLTLPLRVPSVLVTGSLGKTTTCRMVAHILSSSGLYVALSTTQGLFLNGVTRRLGDSATCPYASKLLLDRKVQAAVFELAHAALARDGIAFDGCDVSAVLNVRDNHVGFGGIDSVEDIARIKSQVAQVARRMVVLNADDPFCLAMRDQVRATETCLVTMGARNAVVLGHLEQGCAAAVFQPDAGEIRFLRGEHVLCAVRVEEIPSTWGGLYRPAVGMAMFAMALAIGLGIEPGVVADGLRSFVSDERGNPGRMNVRNDLPYRLILTTGDGPEPIRALVDLVGRLPVGGRRILMLAAMGNRTDAFLRSLGRTAAGAFDTYVCSDSVELRGRSPGEVATLLAEGLDEAGVTPERIRVAENHDAALRMAFAEARQGDLLVVQSFHSGMAHALGLVPPRRA